MLESQRTTHGIMKQKNSTFQRTHYPEKENQQSESKVPTGAHLNVPTKVSEPEEVQPKSTDVLIQEEQCFMEELSKTNQLEDPLLLWSKYYQWIKIHFPKNDEKEFEVLTNLTRALSQHEKYKQNPYYVNKWTSYARLCVDQEKIMKYMEENGIGTQLAIFYKAYCVVYTRQRKFGLANDWALAGQRKGAKPEHKMNEYMNEFKENMKQRLHRIFYSQGKYLSDDDLIDFSVLNNSQKESSNLLGALDHSSDAQSFESNKKQQDNLKRRSPYSGVLQGNTKKVRLNDFVNSVKTGEFNTYVDQGCRETIPESTKLVNEYDALCSKYNFPLTPVCEGKFMSWVSQQKPKAEPNISLDVSGTTNTSFSSQKNDTNPHLNPLLAQFQLPKNLRKPLKEIKANKPSPTQAKLTEQLPIFPYEKALQEITERYMPKMGSVLEEDGPEEGHQEEREPRKDTLTSFDEILQYKDVSKSTESSLTSSFKLDKKKDSSRKVVLLDDVETSAEKKAVRMKFRKTPYKQTFHSDDEEEEEEEKIKLKLIDLVLWDQLHEEPQATEPIPELSSPPVIQEQKANISRSLDFGGINVADDCDKNERAKEELRRSPIYEDLFVDKRSYVSSLGAKKVAKKKSVKPEREIQKFELGATKGVRNESIKRIIPEIYRNDNKEMQGNSQMNELEKYLPGNPNWKRAKEPNSPKRKSDTDDLDELLFSDFQAHYLK